MNRRQPTRHTTITKEEDLPFFETNIPQNRHIFLPFPGPGSIAVGKQMRLIGLSINDGRSGFMALSMLFPASTCVINESLNGNEPDL